MTYFSKTHLTQYLFNRNYYDQIDGMAMGSPLGPVLANLFMGYHEKIWLKELVVLYQPYVDDSICLLACEKDADELFTFLNYHHPNINFTFEKEKDNKTTFLGICINKTNHSSCTSVFQKSMSMGLYTNISSFTPFSYKIGLIKTLIHQTCAISSSWNLFHDEIKNTKHLLEKNMYPPYLIDKQIKLLLNNKLSENDTAKENSNKANTTYHT